MKFVRSFALFGLLVLFPLRVTGWIGMPTPELRVEGKNLVDSHGNKVVLHGFAQTFSPWFNEEGTQWTNYDVEGCLEYNQGIIDAVLAAGWKVNFVRMHMDPYWSNTPGCTGRYEGEECFDEQRFVQYLDEVFVPMAEYAVSKGLYVVLRPPGVCPENIEVGGVYHNYLIRVWSIASKHPDLKNHPGIMFELANEPVNILGPDGTYGSGSQGHFDNLKIYFQTIADTIRKSADNILWIPGLGWQSKYMGFAVNPVEGENIGYAVHVYPGWFNSGEGYEPFQEGWNEQVQPVADFAPVMVTEMDWAPEEYNSSWGKGITGIAGGEGFGANFKKITDDAGNVSWLLFTSPHLLAQFNGILPADGEEYTFLNDPEACPWPVFHWFQEYAGINYPRPEFEYRSHADNGDGTYTNPLIFADFPDPDVIRVEDVYYMVSTTMHIFPGATLLQSRDLVNWEFCSNPLDMIESSACYNLDGCNRYSHGQWASSLKYHNGTFYILFNALDEGSYLLTAKDPEGPWEKNALPDVFHDPGLFFDDDGKTYVAYGINHLRVAELDENFHTISGSDQEVFTYTFREGLEGSHLYKINGYYYIYATYGGWPAFQVALRSENIYGPYEEKKLLEDDNIHQGALVETQTGEWWTVLFYDKGAYGRLPNLQPVTWIDDWPEIGENGQGVTTFRKPDVGREYPIEVLPTNDNFRDYKLGMQWGWNHNPVPSGWSLFDRADHLRLYAVSVVQSLPEARNTLTQRIFGYHSDTVLSYGTIKMQIDSMKEGDIAGLAVFQDPYASIGVTINNGEKQVVFSDNGVLESGPVVTDSVIYLRAVVDYHTSKANFYYSIDNITYTKFGSELDMKYELTIFTGNKFCIFNYATLRTGGFVDIDWFSTEVSFSEDMFFDTTFNAYDRDALTLDSLIVETDTLALLTGSVKTLYITALFLDGHTENVAAAADYSNPNPKVAEIKNGQLIARSDGTVNIGVSYSGKLGGSKSVNLTVNCSTFPFTGEWFNPSIFSEGTFDEASRILVTGQYGFGGWHYNNGIDLSRYEYLVVELDNRNTCGASFRIFDESSYWSEPFMYTVGTQQFFRIELHNMEKEVDGQMVPLNPGHLYYIGFWSYGGCAIDIKDIYLEGTFVPDTSQASNMIEAELGTLGSDFSIVSINGADAITVTTDLVNQLNPGSAERVATYTVRFPESGSYELYARVMVGPGSYDDDSHFIPNGFGYKDPEQDSAWLRVNGLASAGYTEADELVDGGGSAGSNVWKWINLSQFAEGDGPEIYVVQEDSLVRIFQVGARENGLYFDKFVFGKSGLYFTVDALVKGDPGSETLPRPGIPLAEGRDKFLGSAWSDSQDSEFPGYWNQLTPENSGKWGSVEAIRNQMNWSGMDAAYNEAKRYGMLFKQHTLLWGAQQPDWMGDLDSAEQRREIEEWFAAQADRYGSFDMIDVVNEPIHNAPNGMTTWGATEPNIDYAGALGGAGKTGWDWIIEAFRLARQYFPGSCLILNEYSVINSASTTQQIIEIVNLLKTEGLIDGIGEQGHAFTTYGTSTALLKANLDALAETGIPIYISELDIDGLTDLVQLKEIQRVFPIFWEHPGIAGITLWGYRYGLWRTDQGAYLIDQDGRERLAMTWLKAYVNDTLTNVENIIITSVNDSTVIRKLGETLILQAEVLPRNATIKNFTWSAEPAGIATIDQSGLLTAVATGQVTVNATAWDGSGVKGTFTIDIDTTTTGIFSLAGNFQDELQIYPNPSFDGIIYISGLNQTETISVLDLTGKRVALYNCEGRPEMQIHPEQGKGIYVLEFRQGNACYYHKVIIRSD
ncbi:MAG: endo-1,4-beta-xylanase [Bacteroidales bacterium]|nr:endo-1,4-beta-xylanase [Bacteroidales bacterium]MBN2699760.1 endo-1,4-beta-xylanase [Bacteroidales bacterium]